MFMLVEARSEVQQAQAALEATIDREFKQTATRDIGWQGGRQRQAVVRTDGNFWFWSQDHRPKNAANPRRLNWFGRIGEGPGVAIAVEVNVPYNGRNDAVGGFFARDATTGRVYLFHSGRVGGGAEGVKKDALVAWADLGLQPVYAADGTFREGILVMPVSGRGAIRPAVAYVQDVLNFKDAVRRGETAKPEAKAKERKLRDYFDEFFGRKKGRSPGRDIDYISRHGEVVKALRDWRRDSGLQPGQRIVKTGLLDLGVSKGSILVEAFEVKSSASRGDVYTGIGQLTVHAEAESCSRTLVLPAGQAMARDLKGECPDFCV
jgi:hypothetical protein